MPKFDTNGFVTELEPHEIFVFGSNIQGHHAGGAAKQAYEQFGAEWGVGAGPRGQSWAIPTMGSFNEMRMYVHQFLEFAEHCPLLTFLVTPIGTGIAGHSLEDIRPLFKNASANVVLLNELKIMEDKE